MQHVRKYTIEERFPGFSDPRNTTIGVPDPENDFFEKVPFRAPHWGWFPYMGERARGRRVGEISERLRPSDGGRLTLDKGSVTGRRWGRGIDRVGCGTARSWVQGHGIGPWVSSMSLELESARHTMGYGEHEAGD